MSRNLKVIDLKNISKPPTVVCPVSTRKTKLSLCAVWVLVSS